MNNAYKYRTWQPHEDAVIRRQLTVRQRGLARNIRSWTHIARDLGLRPHQIARRAKELAC